MVGPCAPSATVSRSGAAAAVLRVAFILAAVCTVACGQSPVTLANLENLDQLRDRFNQDAGKPRVVLLLSPT